MIKLFAFLGNPGAEYLRNRHNAGWQTADKLALPLSWAHKFHGAFASYNGIYFLKPETFMNESGLAVGEAASFYKLKSEDVLIVHDELDLLPGFVSLKHAGGLNGHNGLRSINASLGGPDFWRIRIGIGRPQNGDVYNWVLSNFGGEDAPLVEAAQAAAASLVEKLLTDEPDTNLKEWSKKKI
jgi:PTH1 family peptidyl-tRNA hydrolase